MNKVKLQSKNNNKSTHGKQAQVPSNERKYSASSKINNKNSKHKLLNIITGFYTNT